MEDLPEELFAEVIKRITRTSDLNSLSLVSKQLYKTEGDQRGAIRIGYGPCPATEALVSLCTRFPNLHKVEIDYSGWMACNGNQLDNQGLFVLSSHWLLLTSLTLSFFSCINDSGLGYLAYLKKLASLRLNSIPNITSRGLLAVAVGCKSLSALHLIDCQNIGSKDFVFETIGSKDWLEYLGCDGSLEELIVKNCEGISQDDFLKFGPGWMKLQKFVFEIKKRFFINVNRDYAGYDPSYDAHSPNMYGICCESLKDLSLTCIEIATEKGLRFLLGRCKALERLCLEYVRGLNDNDMIALSRSCNNLKSISLWLDPQFYAGSFRTAFTDNSLKALALSCPMLETVELTFAGCAPEYPSEIGFTQEGLVFLIQSCRIRFLVLNGANFFDVEGMEAVSSAPNLETLELVDCKAVTDAGMCFIARAPCLINLTLRLCNLVTDGGVAELVHAQKLESLIIEGCPGVSLQAVEGVARSVQYSDDCASPGHLKRMFLQPVQKLLSIAEY